MGEWQPAKLHEFFVECVEVEERDHEECANEFRHMRSDAAGDVGHSFYLAGGIYAAFFVLATFLTVYYATRKR